LRSDLRSPPRWLAEPSRSAGVLQGECFRSVRETFEGIGAAIVVQPPGDPVKVQPIQWVVPIPYVADSGKESQNPLDLLKPTPRAAVRPVRSPSSTRHASCTNPMIRSCRRARQQGNGEGRQQERPHSVGPFSTCPAPPRRARHSRLSHRRHIKILRSSEVQVPDCISLGPEPEQSNRKNRIGMAAKTQRTNP